MILFPRPLPDHCLTAAEKKRQDATLQAACDTLTEEDRRHILLTGIPEQEWWSATLHITDARTIDN